MALRPILEHPDPRLRLRAARVEQFDAALAALAEDLIDTLHATAGIGLAAPQLGVALRVLVVDLREAGNGPSLYVNPEILARSVPGLVEESCLSVPGVSGNVVRATRVTVRAQERDGARFERELEGMAAVCLQHEIDHLDGTLFVDRLPWWRRLRLKLAAARRTSSAAA